MPVQFRHKKSIAEATNSLMLIAYLPTCVTSPAEPFVQEKSISPDGTKAFAINYPPAQHNSEDEAQCCFVKAKSQETIGQYFFVPDSYVDEDHPGSYSFDYYNVLDYVWSADSSCVAVTLNRRRWSTVTAFKLTSSGALLLELPDLLSIVNRHLSGEIGPGLYHGITAESWTTHHSLLVSADLQTRTAPAEDTKQKVEDHWLKATIAFSKHGKASIKAIKNGVEVEQ